MNWRSTLTVAVVVGGIGFAAGRVYSGDDGKEPPKQPSPEDIQKMMAEMARPVEQHKLLEANAGTWDSDISMWMAPGAEPMKAKSAMTCRSVLGGLYVIEEHRGEMFGKPFEGMAVVGYSKDKQKYFGMWVDNMGSTPEIMWGTADASGKVITFDGEQMNAMGMTFTPRWIVTHDDADHMGFTHLSKYAGMGDDYNKEIEIKYTRKK